MTADKINLNIDGSISSFTAVVKLLNNLLNYLGKLI